MNINPSFSQTLQQQIDALPHAQIERLAFIDFSLQYFGHISRTELIARFRTGLVVIARYQNSNSRAVTQYEIGC